jgi:hypothetical protein
LRFDGNTTLSLNVHGVEYLRRHVSISEAAAMLNKTISERRFAMIDVRDNRKVSNVT